MLLEFRTKNYKSFVDETVFSLMAAPKQTGLDYSVFTKKLKNKKLKGLCSSVLYGPNATGKTNIIGAMDTFRAIVLRGNIKNSEESSSPNSAANALELIPNNSAKCSEPVLLSIKFMENNLLIHYAISLDLGCFLDDSYSRKILKEELFVNEEKVFLRDETLSFGNFKNINNYILDTIHQNEDSLIEISKNSLNDEELFLVNGFKLIFSQDLAKLITSWFENKFMVVYRADSMQLIKRFVDPQKQTVYVEKTTNSAAKLFGINSNALGYVVSDDETDVKLCSIIKNVKGNKSAAMAAEIFESYGTIRFVNIFPLVIMAILTGGTLIVDEFDASIHPMALMDIVNIFHNDDININNAQLIFNTHNPIFLNSNLFRRDEIKFVERDEDTHNSVLYALSDFGTTGEKGVRKHEDYMKHYFIGQYGAIKDIDFTPIFEELISDEREV
ncbi:MAG: ATP-binding protein [Marinifilaceae bacterium]|jgi:AAA15 family ATPase/GTPase|nr:ATP-binding protein [Marinifilaceae bacterium]